MDGKQIIDAIDYLIFLCLCPFLCKHDLNKLLSFLMTSVNFSFFVIE